MQNNIKKIISKNRVTITEVIEKSGISRSAFYDIMNGKAIPSLLNARKISEVLGCKLEDVFPSRY